MEGLKIELILRLLTYDAQVRPQCGLCDRLGVVVVVLLSLHERLHIDRRDDPRLVTQLTQRPADKVSAEARLHANDARRQPSKGLNERQSLDLATKSDLAVVAKTNDVEDFLADLDADRGQGCGGDHGLSSPDAVESPCRLSSRGKQPVHPISRPRGKERLCQLEKIRQVVEPCATEPLPKIIRSNFPDGGQHSLMIRLDRIGPIFGCLTFTRSA